MARKTKSPLEVVQTDDQWYCALRKLPTFLEVEQGSEEFFRPSVILLVSMTTGLLMTMEIVKEPISPQELHKILLGVMRKPAKETMASAHRPLEIHFEDEALAEALQPLLKEAQVAVRLQPQREIIDTLMQEITKQMFESEEVEFPGLLKQRGVKPEQVGSLFSAASAFYRAEPWIQLSNDDILAVQVDKQKSPYYIIVMGQGGQEYGLSVFRSWREVESFFKADNPLDAVPRGGRQALLFNSIPYVSIDDLDAIEKYGWELPAPDLFPVPASYELDVVKRPNGAMLHWYEAALRAIPSFVSDHLVTNPDGTHDPIEIDLQVETYKGLTQVHIRLPGGDLSPLFDRPDYNLDLLDALEDEDADEASLPLFAGMLGMEKVMDEMAERMGAVSPVKDPALKKAQQIMYSAWEEPSPARRIALAKKALKTSPNCADAYLLLAEETAQTPGQALKQYQDAVEAGRRGLGTDFLADSDNIGHYWGILETRPFMRAMAGLAAVQWEIGQKEEAEHIYREMLRLNPGDNQGIRYLLLQLLMDMGRDDAARALLKDYEGDWSPDWAYTSALLLYKDKGDSPKAKQALKRALEINRHVTAYLTGKKRIPSQEPDTITLGGEDEAASYASAHLNHWRKTPGAIEWLRLNSKS